MNKQISTQPYKGTKDFLPEEYLVQEFIFNTWKEVCLKFGYKEYQTPLLENAEIYKAKSGEDVGGKELFTLTDLAGRELAIRPEMTPSVTRMVTKIYKQEPKPIRLFNVSNFCRNERPQKGRNREFWQLNADIFGEEDIAADIEILSLAIQLMLAFNPPENAFVLNYNNRKLIESFLEQTLQLQQNQKQSVVRLMDKYEKYENEEDYIRLLLENELNNDQIQQILNYLKATTTSILESFPKLENTQGVKEIIYIQEALTALGYSSYVKFNPSVIRGFDYYDGMIFEVFDTNKDNPRSLFGGGRYNGLSEIFGEKNMPAVGFAPGNETFRLFLENWNLIPELNKYKNIVYFPVLENVSYLETLKVANVLRANQYRVQLETKQLPLTAALRNANKYGITTVAIYGVNEKENNKVILKSMDTGKETVFNF